MEGGSFRVANGQWPVPIMPEPAIFLSTSYSHKALAHIGLGRASVARSGLIEGYLQCLDRFIQSARINDAG